MKRTHATCLLILNDRSAVLLCHTISSFWWHRGQAAWYNTDHQEEQVVHAYPLWSTHLASAPSVHTHKITGTSLKML